MCSYYTQFTICPVQSYCGKLLKRFFTSIKLLNCHQIYIDDDDYDNKDDDDDGDDDGYDDGDDDNDDEDDDDDDDDGQVAIGSGSDPSEKPFSSTRRQNIVLVTILIIMMMMGMMMMIKYDNTMMGMMLSVTVYRIYSSMIPRSRT